MHETIDFPNLGIHLKNVGKTISVFHFDVAYYGVIIGLGILAGLLIAMHVAKKTGQNQEDYIDLAIYGVIFGIIGARVYYVVFSWDMYKNDLLSIFNIRQGGLAIYGGVIGRWGNFFNREAFGKYTNSLFAMRLPLDAVRIGDVTQQMRDELEMIDGVGYIQVHPTFLYESAWCLLVLTFLFWYRHRQKFQGEIFLVYLAGYGLGRFWIEGLRTDQLLIPGIGIPVSRVLALILFVGATAIIIVQRKKIKKSQKNNIE